jgi:hypothetical protein
LNASKKRGCSQNVALSGITNVAKTSELQGRLEGELQRLSAKLGLNLDLRVVWTPDPPNSLSGEVRGNTIYIYEVEEEKAIQALRHEVLDHLITSRIVKPLVDLINLLIKAREAEIYKEKEEIVEALSKIV